MVAQGFTVFATDIGPCGIAWSDDGVMGVQLPEHSDAAVRARLARRFPDVREALPPAPVRRAINDITALLRGEPRDLRDVPLALTDVPPFHQRVYTVARAIPAGATRTYGDIAVQLGDRALARDVGEALGRNPVPIIVPCHRVLAAGGKMGGFSATGGVATKLRLLAIEQAQVSETPTLFDSLPLQVASRRR